MKENKVEEKFYSRAAEVKEELIKAKGKAFEKGIPTGFYSLDQLISFKKNFTTIIYSPPHVGKSVITLDILMGCAERDGSKIFVYSPEFRQTSEIFFALIQARLSQTMYGEHAQDITDTAFLEALVFVDEHFVILSKPKRKKNNGQVKLTISKVYGQALAAEKEYGWKFDFIFIDPFNFLEKDSDESNMQVQEYILDINDKMAEYSELLSVHTIITAHTRDMELVTDKDTGIQYYPVPHPSQIMSGQSWFRGAYQIVAFWRCPEGVYDKETGTPYPANATDIICQKSKPYGIGKLGKRRMFFDENRHRMCEEIDGLRWFANEYANRNTMAEIKKDNPSGGIKPSGNWDTPVSNPAKRVSALDLVKKLASSDEEIDEDAPF